MTLKIALITDAWKPQVNGVVTTLDQTCKVLKESGHDMKLISPDRFLTVPCPSYPSIKLAIGCYSKLARELDEFRPQRIHIATEGPLGLAGRKYCQKNHLQFTSSFHTLFAEYIHMRFRFPVSWGYAYLRWFHAPAKQVMVATDSMESNLVERGLKNQMVRWSRGVDTDLFFPRDKQFLSFPRPVSMYVGRVAVEKGIDDFLSLDLPGSKVVVGDGPQLDELKKKYPNVLFTGFQHGESLAKYMASADVFVFPSRTDTFGIVMLDSLACGVPVAAYPVQGPIDVLIDNKTGCMRNELKQAVIDALKLDSRDCRRFALNYSWPACARQFIDNLVPVSDAHDPESIKIPKPV